MFHIGINNIKRCVMKCPIPYRNRRFLCISFSLLIASYVVTDLRFYFTSYTLHCQAAVTYHFPVAFKHTAHKPKPNTRYLSIFLKIQFLTTYNVICQPV